jgi:hypothetical protein
MIFLKKRAEKWSFQRENKKSKVFAIGCKEPSISLIRSSKLGKKSEKSPSHKGLKAAFLHFA